MRDEHVRFYMFAVRGFDRKVRKGEIPDPEFFNEYNISTPAPTSPRPSPRAKTNIKPVRWVHGRAKRGQRGRHRVKRRRQRSPRLEKQEKEHPDRK